MKRDQTETHKDCVGDIPLLETLLDSEGYYRPIILLVLVKLESLTLDPFRPDICEFYKCFKRLVFQIRLPPLPSPQTRVLRQRLTCEKGGGTKQDDNEWGVDTPETYLRRQDAHLTLVTTRSGLETKNTHIQTTRSPSSPSLGPQPQSVTSTFHPP